MEAPSAEELKEHPVVKAAFAAAWADSFPDDPALRHEEGGFIYANPTTGEIIVRRVPPGGKDSLNLDKPPLLQGVFLVATYHTHPKLIVDGGDPDPSPDDIRFANETGVPWLLVTELGVLYVGPGRRLGGLNGPLGYPR